MILFESSSRRITHLAPEPINTPAVQNNPPTLPTANPLNTILPPKSTTPQIAVFRGPNFLISLAFTIANADVNEAESDPTKDNTAGPDNPSSTRAACITPQAYVVPTAQKRIMQPEQTIAQPYPPSGAWASASREARRTSSSVGGRRSVSCEVWAGVVSSIAVLDMMRVRL